MSTWYPSRLGKEMNEPSRFCDGISRPDVRSSAFRHEAGGTTGPCDRAPKALLVVTANFYLEFMLLKAARRALAIAAVASLAASGQAAVFQALADVPAAYSLPEVPSAVGAAPGAPAAQTLAGAPSAAPVLAPAAAIAAPLSAVAAEPARPLSARPAAARPAAVPASSVSGLLAGSTFDGAAARRALVTASGDDYSVRVLTRRDGERARVVVLLGEAHIKSPEAAELGRRVIERFRTYGYEGYANDSPAARRFLSEMQEARKISAARAPQKFGEGSTIDEARRLAARRRGTLFAVRRMLESMPAAERNEILAASTRAAREGESKNIAIVDGDGKTLLDAAALRDMLTALAADAYARVEAAFVPRPVHLEAGHRPGLAENIALRGAAVRRFARRAVPAVVAAYLFSTSFPVLHSVALAGVSAILYVRVGDWIPRRLLAGPLGALFPLRTGIIRGRDRTMARNIAAASASSAGADPVLAIVGADHVPGIARRLTQEHGFSAAGLDALSPR